MSLPTNTHITLSTTIQQDDRAEAHVESLDHESRGVARVHGKTVFIEGALPGETVIFRYHNKKKNYDTGGLVEVLVPAPDRVTPLCTYFGVCGGCSLQHLRPAAQLTAKQKILHDALERIGKALPQTWLAPLEGQAWGYRRRARLGVKLVPKKGGVLVGFREKRSAYITGLASCEVLAPAVARLLPALRELIAGLSCADRVPQIEVAVGENTSALVFRHLVPLTDADRTALSEFGAHHSIQIWLQPQGPDSVAPLWPLKPEPLLYRLPEEGVEFQFAATDFIQVNAELNRKMIHQALTLLAPESTDKVLDLFCGLGNFSLPLARHAEWVLGIEGDAGLIAKARVNAAHNHMSNVEFVAANLYAETGPPAWGDTAFDLWLLDPPRTGALEVVKRLGGATDPRRILYISCNPATLARDTEVLVHTQGYTLVQAGVMDMFPQTSHVEAMALFVRS